MSLLSPMNSNQAVKRIVHSPWENRPVSIHYKSTNIKSVCQLSNNTTLFKYQFSSPAKIYSVAPMICRKWLVLLAAADVGIRTYVYMDELRDKKQSQWMKQAHLWSLKGGNEKNKQSLPVPLWSEISNTLIDPSYHQTIRTTRHATTPPDRTGVCHWPTREREALWLNWFIRQRTAVRVY